MQRKRQEVAMRKTFPAILGLALALGSVGASRLAAQEVTKEKVKVEHDGDVKVKGKTYDETGKHKYKTKVKTDDGVTKVKTKQK
jgi:hypothetical protein